MLEPGDQQLEPSMNEFNLRSARIALYQAQKARLYLQELPEGSPEHVVKISRDMLYSLTHLLVDHLDWAVDYIDEIDEELEGTRDELWAAINDRDLIAAELTDAALGVEVAKREKKNLLMAGNVLRECIQQDDIAVDELTKTLEDSDNVNNVVVAALVAKIRGLEEKLAELKTQEEL